MAEVFLAKSFGVEGFERLLAIKKILPAMGEDEEFITMFIDEARIAVQLSHANITQIYELGKHGDSYYIAMEYVSGRDLRTLLDRARRMSQPMPQSQVAYIAQKICEGLDYAHRKSDTTGREMNIIHRDVSPQNVLLSYDGEVKLIDFGIAKAANRSQKTQVGILKGKFGYMSPEQVRGLPIDRRSDIFAVGVCMYEMLTGTKLFVGESDYTTLEKVRNAEVKPPREVNPEIPEELEQVVMKALARDVEDRYQWASDLQEDLMRFLISSGRMYTAKDLAGRIRSDFADEIKSEQEKIERFSRLSQPQEMVGQAQSSPQGQARPDSRGRRGLEVVDAEETTQIFDASAHFADPPVSEAEPDAGEDPEVIGGRVTATGRASPPALQEPPPPPVDDGPPITEEATSIKAVRGAMVESEPPPATPLDTKPAKKLPKKRAGRPAAKPKPRRRGGKLALGGGVLLVAAAAAAAAVFWFDLLPPKPGALVISTEPKDVEIMLEGELIATSSPYEVLDLLPGEYTVSIRRPGTGERKNLAVQVPAGQRAEVTLVLPSVREAEEVAAKEKEAKGQVAIVSKPEGASVHRNGESLGETPLTVEAMALKKEHSFVLSHEGYEDKTIVVKLEDSEKLEVTAEMEHDAATLARLEREERERAKAREEARRRREEEAAGATASADPPPSAEPSTPRPEPAKPEPPEPEAVAETTEEEPAEEEPVQLGSFIASTSPVSQVIVNGQDTGRWTPVPPTSPIELPPGDHEVTFRSREGDTKTVQVTIRPGRQARLVGITF